MNKKRILITGEGHYLNTGYGKINKNLCQKFHNMGYEVAEHANYGHVNYPGKKSIPWKYYGNLPGLIWNQPPPQEEEHQYADPLNQFGKWRFEDVCLNFQPDYVISYLDHWMSSYQLYSPFRKCFNHVWVPTVDAESQNEQWISDYSSCDAVLTYTDFAHKTLQNEGGGVIPLRGVAPPGVDHKIFCPVVNKKQHKNNMGMMQDIIVVGTVMRNQPRKLYPDLFKAFRLYLDKCKAEGRNDLAQKSYLYIHSSFPDLGWDMNRLIKESGLSHKIIWTYVCKHPHCGTAFTSFWQDATAVCMRCNYASAGLPSTHTGISDENLAGIYNLMDVYVQYANSEGQGMPAVEAAGCGVPVMYVNYSGMEDFSKLGGIPIEYKALYRENSTHCYRAVPNNEDLANKLFNLLSKDEREVKKIGYEARKAVLQHFNWDKTANKLAEVIESLPVKGWNQPLLINNPNFNLPNNLSDRDFVLACFQEILGEPDKVSSYMYLNMLKNLSYGSVLNTTEPYINEDSILANRQAMKNYGRENVVQELRDLANKRNYWERVRGGLEHREIPDWMKVTLT